MSSGYRPLYPSPLQNTTSGPSEPGQNEDPQLYGWLGSTAGNMSNANKQFKHFLGPWRMPDVGNTKIKALFL